jgi:hypothetical protein
VGRNNGKQAKSLAECLLILYRSHLVGWRGTLATHARTANGALSTNSNQWKSVMLVPALKERRLAIPALRSEEDGSACT